MTTPTYDCHLAYRPGGNPDPDPAVAHIAATMPWFVQCNEAHEDRKPYVQWFQNARGGSEDLSDHIATHLAADLVPTDVLERLANGLAADHILNDTEPDPFDVAAHTLALVYGMSPGSPTFGTITAALALRLTELTDRT